MTKFKANQYEQPWQQQQQQQQQRRHVESARSVQVPATDKSDQATLKNVDYNLALNHSIKPCPFTFFTAVKRKLELGRSQSSIKKTYEPDESKAVPTEGTMDFIKPLKVPDVKISPKADFSSRESLLSDEELSKKIEAAQRDEMNALKVSSDRVPRKLEFSSSSSTSLLNYENIEPLKVPDLTISKKKDLSRDSSREKENRTKRVKKDDIQDISKWPKSQRHISRKEIAESIVNRNLKADRDAFSSKPKPKLKSLAATGMARKDDDNRRYKLSNIPLSKSKNKTLESRASTSSSESLYPLDKGTRLHEKILIREGYKAMISEINERKHKDNCQLKQSHSSKHQNVKSNPVKPIDTLTRETLNKRISEKQKSAKAEPKQQQHSSEISEDLTTALSSSASLSKNQNSGATETSSSSTVKGNKDVEKSQFSPAGGGRTNDDHQYSDEILASSEPISNNSMIETKISQDSSLSEKLMDPFRISFRDNSYSNQSEFVDLVTPDINLTIRSSKRRKAPIGRENDSDEKDSKQSSLKTSEETEQSQLVMGMQRQTNMLDSISESLQQAIDTDRSRIAGEDSKRHTSSSSQNDHNGDSKGTEISTSAESNAESKKVNLKPSVKVVEVQTQTANDIATQTETTFSQQEIDDSSMYSRIVTDRNDISGVSLDESRYDGAIDRIEDISIPNRMRTTSEISMYETTSSIKTETGTEISISTRDVTCSFNKYLDLEMAQLIKDERQRYDKIEMLFKSREKTLNDRTKKLIKLEEQKRALRDTGQDSRISSVKKKQRALLLKLQQEKDEMNRLKELHKIASQERKLLLQKQRDMFNPEMSTKTILNKLKRSADSQSPRRLSGPMKGYDIRSNSSISSLVDSDKSQLDRSQFDLKLNLSDISPEKNEQPCASRLVADLALQQGSHCADNAIDKKLSKIDAGKQQRDATVAVASDSAVAAAAAVKLKYDIKARKFEEKMPKADKMKQYDLDLVLRHNVNLSQDDDDDRSISEHIKSESDAIIEEFTQVLKSQFPDIDSESLNVLEAPETIEAFKKMQRISPSTNKADKEAMKKLQQQQQQHAKRKGSKNQKSKAAPQSECASKSDDLNCVDDLVFRHLSKRSKIDNDPLSDDNYQNSMLEELDFNESQSSLQALLKHSNLLKERNQQILRDINDERNNAAAENSESPLSQKEEEENVLMGNTSARSQLSLTISHQSSNDSDRSYSRSVVIRSQQDHHHHTTGLKNSKKLEQILKAREATLVSRRNCVEEWIAWHARLREEENRVARMEQAAYKLVSATAKALSHNDTTVSSDTSDVEGRIELLTQKLADRRLEMARLKKEARKQAKQRLRALEANLLNQIKKYDATIRDMRKKLEAKRAAASSKEIEKQAIDSKSVIDFKVPEIPIKKIQEIYKNSDLLRSKSDSDVISFKSVSGEPSSSRLQPATVTPYTINEELDNELSERSDNSALHSYKTKSNSEELATQRSLVTEREAHEIKRSSSQSSNISEDIPSEAYSVKSQSEHVPTAKISEVSLSEVSEKLEQESANVESKKAIDEDLSPESDDASLIFSKKLDHIQLHNKELNDDIHNLENDLKTLTEMMSSFSKKSSANNSKSKSIDQSHEKASRDKSTSGDISEELPESNVQNSNIDEDLQARVKKILSDVVPETDDLVTSIEELDVRPKTSETPIEDNRVTITEEIPTQLTSQAAEDEKRTLDAQTDTIISEVIVSAVDKEDEDVSPEESRRSVQKSRSTSDDVISAQIDNTCRSDELASKRSAVEDHADIETKISASEKEVVAQTAAAEQVSIERAALNESINDEDGVSVAEEVDLETDDSPNKTAESDNDWVSSDSFDIQHFEKKDSKEEQQEQELERTVTPAKANKSEYQNGMSDMEDSALFIPRGESTNIQDSFVLKLDDTSENFGIRTNEFNDILDIIEKTKIEEDPNVVPPAPAVLELESKILSRVEEKAESPVEVTTADDTSESIEEEIEGRTPASGAEDSANEESSVNDIGNLPQIEVGAKIPLINEEDERSNDESFSRHNEVVKSKEEGVEDRGSSDGEQRDNLVEFAESRNDTIEKSSLAEEKPKVETEEQTIPAEPTKKPVVNVFLNRTFEVIKDPEYEDISEESLEVSEILDKSERTKRKSKKFSKIPEKYVIRSKSDEVLRILDEISANKSTASQVQDLNEQNREVSGVEEKEPVSSPENEVESVVASPDEGKRTSRPLVNSPAELSEDEGVKGAKVENAQQQQQKEEDETVPKIGNCESSQSDGMDTPSGISEIELDSPKAANDNSRLDVDALDDDLLSGNSLLAQPTQENEAKTEFHTRPMGVSSEKDIKAMIHKLQASLEQPGIEYAALENKLLQIENLKIELEIKKLEAEEVSYYFREIPNKPPPPYTPPGAVRLSTSFNDSPSPPPSVVPTSVEELVLITDRIAAFIHEAKQSGEHVPSLEAPSEIREIGSGKDDSGSEKDRRIYNLFLFDLCKELVTDMYQADYEEPKPSWLKISTKAKPNPRIAKSLDELNEYVSKEVATLLGLKSKPQRENLVMRWSRKRRDRVDELLAKEAQQEEKEWTNYDLDGLTVKNELTTAVLNNLVAETTKCVKEAYAKKRRLAEPAESSKMPEMKSAQAQTAR